jgi:hypothetical protein
MPQASPELRAEFEDDGVAWAILQGNFLEEAGCIYPAVPGYKPNEKENRAIQYLFEEWDYAYDESKTN